MDVRELLAQAERRGLLTRVRSTISPELEMAALIHALGERMTVFEAVQGWPYTAAAGLFSRREYVAMALGVSEEALMARLLQALRQPLAPQQVNAAPCQEVILSEVDLGRLPILTHFPGDGGPYVTSAVLIVRDPEVGLNMAFHRLMRLGPRSFAVRLVEGRGTHTAWLRSNGNLPVVACIGAPPQVQIAAAISPAPGVSELDIANALAASPVVQALGSDLPVPADTEIVLEGHLTGVLSDEGPFVDLTRTRDFVRKQPVLEVERITHRREPIYQALLPGGAEHRLLMGMPREPTIYAAVSEVCKCLGVVLSSGGANWLHAVVQIHKAAPDDGLRAIEAAFRGHSSLKHVVVVDEDVDPADTEAVEWAIATRFQADRDLVIKSNQPSSSLDPSAHHMAGKKASTAKMGLDATIPWDGPQGPAHPEAYRMVAYSHIDLAAYDLVSGEAG